MNSNRVVEPFSPTFEHGDDFMTSNHTSFRPDVKSKNSSNFNKYKERCIEDPCVTNIIPTTVFKEIEFDSSQDIKIDKSRHNRTNSNLAEEIRKDKLTKDIELLKETGKFISPLNESSDKEKLKGNSNILDDSKELRQKTKRRPKTGNGRYSRRSKAKNKSEERQDKKRIFSKSVEQSHIADNSSTCAHDISAHHKLGRQHDEDYFSAEEDKGTLISPSNKINKLIKESLK